jgi:uncharacterized membrane protein YedE/YeeE
MMPTLAAALIAGALFGVGLVVSQMIDPGKVLAFLDIAGRWDPSLVLVMAGALMVAIPGFRLARRQDAPVLGGRFDRPTRQTIDRRLVTGAAIFGIGWGLVGFCPGPAIAALAFGRLEAVIFVLAMVAGAWVFHAYRARRSPAPA